ncbi:hypothetical protein LR48_Vigan08g087100 [Vigna angularis]|uniref:Uncharacterized protein n=1 Tax=Phaseolus angularis TaxID=3914 RepID=A0A0L9V5V3_PHAAN|nr:hypothetical protein LR48_Vigan08g087100 [Vigna angularis]
MITLILFVFKREQFLAGYTASVLNANRGSISVLKKLSVAAGQRGRKCRKIRHICLVPGIGARLPYDAVNEVAHEVNRVAVEHGNVGDSLLELQLDIPGSGDDNVKSRPKVVEETGPTGHTSSDGGLGQVEGLGSSVGKVGEGLHA